MSAVTALWGGVLAAHITSLTKRLGRRREGDMTFFGGADSEVCTV